MNQQQFVTTFADLSKQEKIRLLLRLAHEITVIARDAYFQGRVQNPAKLIKANEVQHRLIGMIIDLVDRHTVRTDKEIAQYLLAGFADLSATKMLEEIIK